MKICESPSQRVKCFRRSPRSGSHRPQPQCRTRLGDGLLGGGSTIEWVRLPPRLTAGEALVARLKAFDACGNALVDLNGAFGFVERLRVGAELEAEPDRIPAAIELVRSMPPSERGRDLPRDLSLAPDGTIRQSFVPELKRLRIGEPFHAEGLEFPSAAAGVQGSGEGGG